MKTKPERLEFVTRALATGIALSLLTASWLIATGCSTTNGRQETQLTESRLIAAGFITLTASTPGQQQMLKTLPPDRISAVRRTGKVYFVYPDQTRNIIYIGNNAQYLAYEQVAQHAREQALVKEDMEAINRSATDMGWEVPWGDWNAGM